MTTKQDMTKICTAAALAVRTFITGSSNLSSYDDSIRQIGIDLDLRLNDIDNIKKTRGSWLGTMVDFLGKARVDAVYQLITNSDKKPTNWGSSLTAPQKSALNIQQHTDVYNSFKTFATLWKAGKHHPTWQEEAGVVGMSNKQSYENLAVRAASHATANCGETSLLAYLLLTTLPKNGKYQKLYKAASALTVGWYHGTNFDHAYVIVSNNGYNTDKGTVASYCICDPWLGKSYPDLKSDLHYDGKNVKNVGQTSGSMPEMKLGAYTFASTSGALKKIQGVMQIFHSAFLDEWAKL
ncbi:hypothetical protein [Adonisia turfae]|uniref:Uncharacterized protein n=1 Tax=Adonisia turfae CCMR0081 TaxID=2292702 RepID=A0A6M0RZL6_9CYAN|nr:hypothetical protein [Adonisia turfae]NEZ61152.1 hypothetical protein [Adonisia turfae CCMR0081]